MEYVYRPVRDEEMDELADLLHLVFGDGRSWFYNIITKDPWRRPHNTRIALHAGRIVSHVQTHLRPIYYGRSTLVMGGIGHVATHPDHRRQGLSTRLLTESIELMESDGYHLSLLYTGINDYYAKLGWRTVELHDLHSALGDAPAPSGSYTVEPVAVPEELPGLAAIYDSCAPRWIGMLARNLRYWQVNHTWAGGQYLADDPRACLKASRDGSTRGYLRGRIVHCAPERACVDEICWLDGDDACIADLLAAFLDGARAASKQVVRLDLGSGHPAIDLLGGAAAFEAVPNRSVMFRVISVPGLLCAASAELSARVAQAGMETAWPLTLDCEIGAACVFFGPRVVATPHTGPADLTLSQVDFLRLFLGLVDAAELQENGLLGWRGAERVEELAGLFPRRAYHYVRYDKF